jgi:hypothetical protein
MSPEPVARAHPESVVMDIGGAVGGLVVHWDPDQLDTPIEISPTGRDTERQHQHILKRPMPEHTFYAAAFDAIAEGSYTLWVHGQPVEHDVLITGGTVTELHWNTNPPPPE